MHVPMVDFSAGGVLAGREEGARARFAIEREIVGSGLETAVALDFADVSVISVPFADECVGGLLAGRLTGSYEDHPILAVNATEDVYETIAVTLSTRRLALLFIGSGRPELLGGDRLLNETLRDAWELGRFGAAQLAERAGISPQAANNRLKALVDRGALRRLRIVPSGGGKEFEYETIRTEDADAASGRGGAGRSPSTERRRTRA